MIKSISDTALPENTISGVVFKELQSFPDNRGFFREVIRHTDEFFQNSFGQWSHSKTTRNSVKAWHFHHLQTDWWYVPLGIVHTVLFDNREESPTFQKKIEFKLGDTEIDGEALVAIVKIPPGVLHGCKTLTDTAHLMYITSKTYNPQDEGRFPFNSEKVPHSWGNESDLITVENDRRTFIPPHPRES